MHKRRDRILAGYRVVYKPEHFHHSLNKKGYDGYVFEHRYIVEKSLGRALGKNEIVHHKDGDKLNNDISNLEVLSRSEHAHLHLGTSKKSYCVDCGRELMDSRSKRCLPCSHRNSRVVKDRPLRDDLIKMVEDSSYAEVGRRFGVSDNTIRKWIKQ